MEIESKQPFDPAQAKQILERWKEIAHELVDMLQGKLAIRGQKEKPPARTNPHKGLFHSEYTYDNNPSYPNQCPTNNILINLRM
jgi:hypothetical protein